jgi:hypothetical protein
MIRYARIPTSLGNVYATLRDDALSGIYFDGGRHAPAIDGAWREDSNAAPLRELA